MMHSPLIELYKRTFSQEPAIEPLGAAGSNRRYYRLTAPDGQTLIGVEGTNEEENRAFVEIARCFESHQLPTPRVLAVDEPHLVYIQEDLGSLSLFDAIRHGREHGGDYNEEEAICNEDNAKKAEAVDIEEMAILTAVCAKNAE